MLRLGMLNGCIILRSWDAGSKLSGSIVGLICGGSDTKGVLRGSGEVLLGDRLAGDLLSSRANAALGTANVLLCLLGDVAGVSLEGLCGICGVLRREVLHLSSLGVDNLTGMGQLLVNDLVVGDVDEGDEVDGGHGNQRQTPEGSELDQPVAKEGGKEGLCMSVSVKQRLRADLRQRSWLRLRRRLGAEPQ